MSNAIRIVIAIGCSLVAGMAAADSDFRCRGRIVKTGMSQADVIAACGEPATKTYELVDVRNAKQVIGQTKVWHWTYEMNGTTRELLFDEDILQTIQ